MLQSFIIRVMEAETYFDNGTFRTLDLFAGIGGIRKGFEATGRFQTVFANDNDRYCKMTYDRNFDAVKMSLKDVREISMAGGYVPEFDFLLGGFPCQAFSVAIHGKGFDDEKGRGTLFNEIERLLKEAQILQNRPPAGFLLENVRNLLSHDDGKTFRTILKKLTALGYRVQYRVYNSLDFGVAQNRERIYIVGFLDERVADNFQWPEPTTPDRQSKVTDILDSEADPRYYYNDQPLFDRIKDEVVNPNYVYLYRRNYIRQHPGGYAPTLVASMGLGGHNVPIVRDSKGIRRLSPAECARLQGYNDLHIPLQISDAQAYKQIGNSVTVPVIRAVAEQVVSAFDAVTKKESAISRAKLELARM